MTCINKALWSLIDHSTTANGMHRFKYPWWMSAYEVQTAPLFTYNSQDHWNYIKRKVELGRIGCFGYLRQPNLCKWHHFSFCRRPHADNTREKHLNYEEPHEKRSVHYKSLILGHLKDGLDFEFSKCTFFVGVNTTNAVDEDRCYWNSIQITSNGDTDDYCVHKCFTLGLSCLYSLR